MLLQFLPSSLKLSMSSLSLVALEPTQTVLVPPHVLTDSGMSHLGFGFASLPYLSTFSPYGNGGTPLTCLSFRYFCAPLPLPVSFPSHGWPDMYVLVW